MRRIIIFALSILLAGSLYAAGSSGGSGSGNSGNGGGNKAAPQSTQPTALELYNKGYAASDAGRYQEAADAFKAAIAVKSDYAEAYNMLGFCTRKMGNVSGAFAYYEKALQLKPNFPEAREYYGEAYLQVGNLARAVQQYVILVKAGSKNASELLDQISDYVNKNATG
jgi:tetratricopeptide (TPR) repeat protein